MSPADEKIDVKDTKEMLIAVNELSIFLIGRLKDGIGMDDAMAAFAKMQSDEEFKNIMGNAIKGIGNIPKEISDIDIAEGFELAKVQIDYIPKILGAIK